MANGFDALHPAVQRRLWEMRWTALRPIQDLAIDHLLGGGGDCVIAAPTAGGKTEAAFLPILSRLADDHAGGVRALYVGPLKALINDQFGRVDRLCRRMDVSVHRWHGDVRSAERRALVSRPSGVLLITPESLEATCLRRATDVSRLFGRLDFVVIDELHDFLDSVRGAHLRSLLDRIGRRSGCDPVRVGLSATLADPDQACRWLRPDSRSATYLHDPNAGRSVALRVRVIWRVAPPAEAAGGEEDPTSPLDRSLDEVASGILRACHAGTNLVFANAKGQIEALADALQVQARAMGLPHDVVVHHGSLAADQREDAEERLRSGTPSTAVCSNTLELGIDIGEVDTVIQVSAPWSVSSLAQRIGRSGRRDDAQAVLRAFFVEDEPGTDASFWDRLHLDFLRGLAAIELFLKRFHEPAHDGRFHLSTLVHQLLSTLVETGGLPARELHRRLMACGAFHELRADEFGELLHELGRRDLIAQMAEGDLILGTRGERICEHHSFYAAFVTPDEFQVTNGGGAIGALPATMLPLPGESFLLGGRRWRVLEIDVDRREVRVQPGTGRRPPRFRSPSLDVHPRVQAEMRDLACGDLIPAYLDEVAIDCLARLRATAGAVSRFQPALQPGDAAGRTRLFLFAGTRVQRTLRLALLRAGLEVSDQEVGFDIQGEPALVRAELRTFAERPDMTELAALAEIRLSARATGEKFDGLLPASLWRRAYAAERLAEAESRRFIQEGLDA